MSSPAKPVKADTMACRPSLTQLDAGDNLVYTTDFRAQSTPAYRGLARIRADEELLRGRFEPFQLFG